MWNMQSGIKRKSFNVGPCPPEIANRSQSSGNRKRERCITGLATDALNRTVVASTLDGTINVGFLLNKKVIDANSYNSSSTSKRRS